MHALHTPFYMRLATSQINSGIEYYIYLFYSIYVFNFVVRENLCLTIKVTTPQVQYIIYVCQYESFLFGSINYFLKMFCVKKIKGRGACFESFNKFN